MIHKTIREKRMNIDITPASIMDFHDVNCIVKEGHDKHSAALPHIFNKVDHVMPQPYFL